MSEANPTEPAGGQPPTANADITMSGTAWALLIFLSLLWGGSFIFQQYAVAEMTAIPIVAVRVALAALTLAAVLIVLRQPFPTGTGVWARLALLALINNAIPFSLIVWGQSQTSAGLASVLNALTPLFTALFAHAMLSDERMAQRTVIGIGLGVLGVAFVIGPSAFSGADTATLGIVAVLGAAISYGLAAVFARSFRGMPPMSLAAGQLMSSSVIMVPLALALGGWSELMAAGTTTWSALIALAVACTALAYIVYFQIIALAGATNAALVTILIPLSACALDAALFGLQLTTAQLLGAVIIVAGLLVIDGRIAALFRSRPAA